MDLSLLVFIALVVITATSGAMFSPGQWYERLEKPSWRPPNYVFPIVWTILYAMIAVAGWIAWNASTAEQRPVAMGLWGLQLVLNAAWSWIFFGKRRMRLALLDLLALWLVIAVMIVVFWRIDGWAALLLVPYIAWVTAAGVLNRAMIRLNPDQSDGPIARKA
jgi:tryptophan-rich sensory protein